MSIPRKHHFIPVCYLQHWCSSRDGKLYEYAVKHGNFVSRRVGPRRTGFEEDLYSFPQLPADAAQYLESNFLKLVDSNAAIALRRHLAMTTDLPPKLRNAWSRFLLSLMMRHPDVMTEVRVAAKSLWSKGGDEVELNYEKFRKPEDPETFAEYADTVDPLIEVKARLYLIVRAVFDNQLVGNHLNKMKWAVADVTASPQCLLTSDRPLVYFNLGEPNGSLFLPISPIKLFVAANNDKTLSEFSKGRPSEVVKRANEIIVARARRYVYARDDWQKDFIRKTISTKMEPSPLFKDLDRYEPESTTPSA